MALFDWLFGKREKVGDVLPSGTLIKSQLHPNVVIDWKDSPAHLLLLSKFLHGSSTEYYVNADYWDPVLKEKPAKAIARFIEEQMLEPLDILSRIHLKYNIPDLKKLLKERGLKVSGNKTVLVERLFENDPSGMEKIVAEIQMFKCSTIGETLAQVYVISQNDKKRRLEEIY